MEGIYTELLFYAVFNPSRSSGVDGVWLFMLYDLTDGSFSELGHASYDCTDHALILNDSIVTYTWHGNVFSGISTSQDRSRSLSGFQLPCSPMTLSAAT